MMDKKDDKTQVEIIKQQIDEVLKNLESIKNQTSNIQSASELSKFEKAIAKETDKLAGLLTAKTIQESLDSDALKQKANESLEKGGLRQIKIHDLRHTYATLRITKGDNIADVSSQLGHHSISFTTSTYYHWKPGSNKSQIDELGTLVSDKIVNQE